MNGYNFTERVRKVLQHAREEAFELRHEYVGTEHILLGLCRDDGGVASATLKNLGADSDGIRQSILEAVKPGPPEPAPRESSSGILGAIADSIGMGRKERVDMPYTSRAKKVLELAMSEARELQHSYVGTEHLLLGLMREERGIAAQVLTTTGLTTDSVRTEVIRLLHGEMKRESVPSESVRTLRRPVERQAAITLVVEHPDGRIEAKKFRRAGDAVSFLNELEY